MYNILNYSSLRYMHNSMSELETFETFCIVVIFFYYYHVIVLLKKKIFIRL